MTDNAIFLPPARAIDHFTAHRLTDLDSLPAGIINKEEATEFIGVGQIIVRRRRKSQDENEYGFLECYKGLGFPPSWNNRVNTPNYALDSEEARAAYHMRVLAFASVLSQITDYDTFNQLSYEQKGEVKRLGEEALDNFYNLPIPVQTGGYAYDESSDTVPVILVCEDCGDDSNRDPSVEYREEHTMTLCDTCLGKLENVCEDCGDSERDDDTVCYRAEYDVSLCNTCFESRQEEGGGLNPQDYLERKHERSDNGFIVYKSFGCYYQPPEEWNIAEGSVIEAEFDDNGGETCSYGMNVTSLRWIVREAWVEGNTWKAELYQDDIDAGLVCVPAQTEGKFRVGKLHLLYRIDRDGNRLEQEIVNPFTSEDLTY